MGGLGAIVALIGGWLLFGQLGFGLVPTFAFGSFIMFGAVMIVVVRIQEPKPLKQNIHNTNDSNLWGDLNRIFRAGNWSIPVILSAFLCGFLGVEVMLTWLSSFGLFSLGINPGRMSGIAVSFALSFLVFTLPAGWLATHFGRGRTILVGFMLMTGLFAFGWFIQNETMLITMLVAGGLAWALVSVNALPLIYDMIGEFHIGIATGLYYVATSLAAAIGPQVSGIFIDLSGKNFRMIFLISTMFMALATFIMIQVDRKIRDIAYKQV
jgi:MFS family permease